MVKNFSRPQKYITGVEYWKSPNKSQNDKSSYLDINVRSKYANSLIVALKKIYKEDSVFSIHEMGCGWGTNLEMIKHNFKNAVISANDVWKDAIDFIAKNRNYIELVEQDTFEFIKTSANLDKKFDVIITNAHLIHFKDESLIGLSNLHKICKNAILQENILNLEVLVENMQLVHVEKTDLPDCDYQYTFKVN
jgi:2-polyprenyl-3-methyl-5-hydroxy-6-metoxy-1,4-benzoquinol methylase